MSKDDEIYRLGLQEKIATNIINQAHVKAWLAQKPDTRWNEENIRNSVLTLMKMAVEDTLKEVGGI